MCIRDRGVIDHRTVAEYKSASGPDTYHLVVYDSSSGALMASIYDKSTEIGESYTLLPAKQDGAAVLMALFPVLSKDEEFRENYEHYYDQFVSGYTDMTLATEAMAYMLSLIHIYNAGCTDGEIHIVRGTV